MPRRCAPPFTIRIKVERQWQREKEAAMESILFLAAVPHPDHCTAFKRR